MSVPASWLRVPLRSVGHIRTGNTPSTKQRDLYGQDVPFVKPGDLDQQVPITTTEQMLSYIGVATARPVRKGAVLVSCIGTLGKVGIAGVELATNQQINSIEFDSDIVLDRYGYYACKTLKPWMEKEASATTIAILNKGKFSEALINIAPLAEQRRIANKLDIVLARVDKVNDRLARVAPLLKRFRQSVLTSATAGKLTEEWRASRAVTNWQKRTLDSLCLFIGDGPFGSNLKSDDYTDTGARVVRLENIGHLFFDDTKQTFIALQKYEALQKHTLAHGDLLFSSFVDEEVRVCEFPDSIVVPTINKADCFCIRADATQINRHYLAYRLACRSTYESLKVLVHGATRPRINLRHLRNFEVLVPMPEEQAEIVRRINLLFAYADRLEARLKIAQTATERLTPSLLAKAFRGELVPQDPSDEPASELLRRLQANTTSGTSKQGRRTAE